MQIKIQRHNEHIHEHENPHLKPIQLKVRIHYKPRHTEEQFHPKNAPIQRHVTPKIVVRELFDVVVSRSSLKRRQKDDAEDRRHANEDERRRGAEVAPIDQATVPEQRQYDGHQRQHVHADVSSLVNGNDLCFDARGPRSPPSVRYPHRCRGLCWRPGSSEQTVDDTVTG